MLKYAWSYKRFIHGLLILMMRHRPESLSYDRIYDQTYTKYKQNIIQIYA